MQATAGAGQLVRQAAPELVSHNITVNTIGARRVRHQHWRRPAEAAGGQPGDEAAHSARSRGRAREDQAAGSVPGLASFGLHYGGSDSHRWWLVTGNLMTVPDLKGVLWKACCEEGPCSCGRCPFVAPSVTAGAHTAFPELRADRPYHQPGADSRLTQSCPSQGRGPTSEGWEASVLCPFNRWPLCTRVNCSAAIPGRLGSRQIRGRPPRFCPLLLRLLRFNGYAASHGKSVRRGLITCINTETGSPNACD